MRGPKPTDGNMVFEQAALVLWDPNLSARPPRRPVQGARRDPGGAGQGRRHRQLRAARPSRSAATRSGPSRQSRRSRTRRPAPPSSRPGSARPPTTPRISTCRSRTPAPSRPTPTRAEQNRQAETVAGRGSAPAGGRAGVRRGLGDQRDSAGRFRQHPPAILAPAAIHCRGCPAEYRDRPVQARRRAPSLRRCWGTRSPACRSLPGRRRSPQARQRARSS